MESAPELHSPERPAYLDPGSRGRVASLAEVGQYHDRQARVVELGQEFGGRTVGEMAARSGDPTLDDPGVAAGPERVVSPVV